MATLTETAYYTRRGLALGGILLVAFIVLKVSFNLTRNIWLKLHPPPPPPPTVAFGKLPKVKFPQKIDELPTETKLSYRLETIMGGLPTLPEVAEVYFMPTGKPNLLALERANEKAKKMGFTGKPQPITETNYRWTSGNTPPTTLDMDIFSGKLHFHYPYDTDQELLTGKNLPSNEQAADEARVFLRNNQLLAEDLDEGRVEFSYWDLTPSGLISAISLSEADFVRVDLFRAPLNDLKILPPNPKRALISFLFSGSRKLNKRIVEVKYAHYPIEKESFSTYPLKPINTAWQELQGEEGHIAYLGQNEDGQITIRQVYLAYYEPAEPQNYLQPIYVFEGDKEFSAYVSAIAPEWTE